MDPENWTVIDPQHTVQKGESTDGKTSNFQTRIQGPRRAPDKDIVPISYGFRGSSALSMNRDSARR